MSDESVVVGPAGAAARPQVRAVSGGRRSGRAESESDRRHFLLYRLLPVAASMAVLAAASGVVATQLGETDESAVVARDSSEAIGPRPNGLVATGTAYTSAELTDQAAALLTRVAQGRVAAPAPQLEAAEGADDAAASQGDPVPSAAASQASVLADGDAGAGVDPLTQSPLASAAAFGECARTLGAAQGVLPSAVDLATFEGREAAIIVLPNRAGDGYEVIVTDRFCTPDTERASATLVDG